MTAKKDTDIDNVNLTFGNLAKIVAAVAVVISVAGSYFHLLSRQDQFEKTQTIINQNMSEQLAEIRNDAKESKNLISDMRLTLQRTNTILEQTLEKK